MAEGMPFSCFFHPVRQNVGVMPGPGQPSWAANWKPQMKGGHITWWKEPGSLMLMVLLQILNSQLLCVREKKLLTCLSHGVSSVLLFYRLQANQSQECQGFLLIFSEFVVLVSRSLCCSLWPLYPPLFIPIPFCYVYLYIYNQPIVKAHLQCLLCETFPNSSVIRVSHSIDASRTFNSLMQCHSS